MCLDYESEPETELSLDQQLEYYVNLATSNLPTQKHSKPSKSKLQTTKDEEPDHEVRTCQHLDDVTRILL